MKNSLLMDKVHTYLKENNFYAYRETWPKLAENFLQEYIDAAVPSNKRNLVIDKTWKAIQSFGPQRDLIILELGGSYLKLFKAEIGPKNKIYTHKHQSYQFYEDQVYTPEILFKSIKKQLDAFMSDEGNPENLKSAVFIFTFPIEQIVREDGYIDAICTYFGKTRKSSGIVGMQVGISLQNYLRENGYPNITISVTNDTPIGLLSAKAIEIQHQTNFDAVINIIVGTGTNIAVGHNILMNGKNSFLIANTEFGNFKSVPASTFDEILNGMVDSKDQYLTEKMVSGVWQHQVFKVILKKALEEKLVNADEVAKLHTENMDSGDIERFFRSHAAKNESLQILEMIWYEITQRGATICGITLANIMIQLLKDLNMSHINIGIIEVGSVIEKAHNFKKVLLDTIDTELARHEASSKIKYYFHNPSFQSVLGSAIFDSLFYKQI